MVIFGGGGGGFTKRDLWNHNSFDDKSLPVAAIQAMARFIVSLIVSKCPIALIPACDTCTGKNVRYVSTGRDVTPLPVAAV